MSAALFPFDNSYARLPAAFWQSVAPTPVRQPRWLALNTALATELGLDPHALAAADGLSALSGNQLPHGAASIACAYAGHQFGHFVPQLGDGRAILLGEVLDRSGARRDIQLKGAGPTPYSRRGDGRAAIGPVLREYLLSEAMHALGVPTTRALAAVATGEHVWRETPRPGAILTRVASSHIRVGTFQFFAARGDLESLGTLCDYVIARHLPELSGHQGPALALLQAVAQRQVRLIAQWMQLGFIHGVMNTDNCAISGETLDFGPCAFMDTYNPAQVYSAIDRSGRYAYANQPLIAQWNLARLAETLLPLIQTDPQQALPAAEAVIAGFSEQYEHFWLDGMRRKLGLFTAHADDRALIEDWLTLLAALGLDYTQAFSALGDGLQHAHVWSQWRGALQAADTARLDAWHSRWQLRLAGDEAYTPQQRMALMQQHNPRVIPRNHQVQAALSAAESGDMSTFDTLLAVLRRPFEDSPESRPYQAAPRPEQAVLQTFCGT